MQSVLGDPIVAELVVPPGPPAAMGARVEVPITRAIASSWQPATLVDNDHYEVTLESPATIGDYQLVWINDSESYQAFEPLVVVPINVSAEQWPLVDRREVTPKIEDVAVLTQTRTVTEGGGEIGTFDGTTRPTKDQVEGIIEQAIDLVLSALPTNRFDPSHYERIRNAVSLQAAVLIETSFFRELIDTGSAALYNSSLRTQLTSISAAIVAEAAIGSGRSDGTPIVRIS